MRERSVCLRQKDVSADVPSVMSATVPAAMSSGSLPVLYRNHNWTDYYRRTWHCSAGNEYWDTM